MSGLAASPTSTPSASTTTSTRSPGEQKRGPGRHPDRLAILTESDVSRYLWQREPTRHNIDLLAAVRRRDVVLFRLDADRRPLLASMLAAAIVQDLLTIAAELQHQPVPTLVLKTSSPPSRPAASATYSAVAAPLA